MTAAAQTPGTVDSPAQQQHQSDADSHAAGVDMRGDHAMGFSHQATVHHFTLLPDGGIIAVDTKSEHDDATRDEIRAHLTHIAAMFSATDFDIPMFIHDTIPPGVPTMKERRKAIRYKFQPTAHGAQVRIKTHDPAAIEAVHEFLVFQIKDHRTGDPVQVNSQPVSVKSQKSVCGPSGAAAN